MYGWINPPPATDPAPVEPGTIAAVPVTDPDLGRPHIQAPPLVPPTNAYLQVITLSRRGAAAKTAMRRTLPKLVADIVISELDWLLNSSWAKSSGHLEAVLVEIESLITEREAAA